MVGWLVGLSALEQENGDLAQVKVNEMPGKKKSDVATGPPTPCYLVSWVT